MLIIPPPLSLRNAEDIRREELEAQGLSPNTGLPYDGDGSGYCMTDVRLMSSGARAAAEAAGDGCAGGHTDAGGSVYPAAGQRYADFEETTSVCSCTCLGGASCANHELLLDPGYHPADIVGSVLSLKRASV